MKHASRLLSLLVLTAAFVLLTGSSCKKGTPERAWERGAFQPVPANQKTYSLPGGITIDSLYGPDDDIPESYTPLYMVISNSNSSNTTVTFPTGLVFEPGDVVEYQYMMLLKDFTFTAAPGVNDSIFVPTYGCNEDLSAPDDASFYTLAGIEWDKETEELFNIVASKTLVDSASDLAQDALYEITDGDGLTPETKAALQNLP